MKFRLRSLRFTIWRTPGEALPARGPPNRVPSQEEDGMATTEQEGAAIERGPAADGIGSRRWWVLGVMSVGALIIFIDNTVVNTALPRIALDLRASTSTLQWVIDSYVLLLAGALLL